MLKQHLYGRPRGAPAHHGAEQTNTGSAPCAPLAPKQAERAVEGPHGEKPEGLWVPKAQFMESLKDDTLDPQAELQMCVSHLVNSEATTTTLGGNSGVGGRQIVFETRFHGLRRMDTEISGVLSKNVRALKEFRDILQTKKLRPGLSQSQTYDY